MTFYRILHLSDLHIGDTYLPSQDLAYKITNDIARNGLDGIRSVLVTGDIFHGPAGLNDALIQEAAEFFRTLMHELNEDCRTVELCTEDFLFVPGNHDILWRDVSEDRWEKYRRFLKEFYGNIPQWYDLDDFSFFYPVTRTSWYSLVSIPAAWRKSDCIMKGYPVAKQWRMRNTTVSVLTKTR